MSDAIEVMVQQAAETIPAKCECVSCQKFQIEALRSLAAKVREQTLEEGHNLLGKKAAYLDEPPRDHVNQLLAEGYRRAAAELRKMKGE